MKTKPKPGSRSKVTQRKQGVAPTLATEIGRLFEKAKAAHLQALDRHVESVNQLLEVGEELTKAKSSMKHGEWLPWLERNEGSLGFGERTARRLMGAACSNRTLASDLTHDTALAISRQVWGHARTNPALPAPAKPDSNRTPATNLEAATPPPEPVLEVIPAAAPDPIKPEQPVAAEEPDYSAPDDEEMAYLQRIEDERRASIDKVMASDNRLATAAKLLDQKDAEIIALKRSRDGFMRKANEAIKIAETAQRGESRWKRRFEQLQTEVERLKGRDMGSSGLGFMPA